MTEILDRAHSLERRGQAYALATVVAVDRPVSAKPSDSAIVTPDGRIEGWIGGSCSEPIVIREALSALADGRPRLVRIRQPGSPREPERHGVITEITTCASEGGLDVFVEPRKPGPHLVVAGSSPVTRTLAALAKTLGYRVTAVLDDPSEKVPKVTSVAGLDDMKGLELGPQDAVVVATMNRYDEVAIRAALETDAGYIALVASRARAKSVAEMLRAQGVDVEALERVHSPAGLDLGPSTQEEIALAVLAQAIEERHRLEGGADLELRVDEPGQAVDPVCGMTVAIVEGAISAELEGTTYYFCSPGCRQEFLEHPDRYARAVGR